MTAGRRSASGILNRRMLVSGGLNGEMMTLTIQLPPEAERRLQEKAMQRGETIETVAATVLIDALEAEARDFDEAVEGIRRGIEDFETGRHRAFQEFAAEQRQKYELPGNG
jgi:predicted transcriptional regulator